MLCRSYNNMKFGKLPPIPTGEDKSNWCAFDALEVDDYFPILGYLSECSLCGTVLSYKEIWAVCTGRDETYHHFVAMEDVRCPGCNCRLDGISVLCHLAKVDVEGEFRKIWRIEEMK